MKLIHPSRQRSFSLVVEHNTCNVKVPGSTPGGSSKEGEHPPKNFLQKKERKGKKRKRRSQKDKMVATICFLQKLLKKLI